mmetsp:Transcript_22856/g.71639  ORF Transcript_22856/g.71639 Transcript_22856/m.71639 type:complete len:277 (+) Transcript_22856:694-1524(+)
MGFDASLPCRRLARLLDHVRPQRRRRRQGIGATCPDAPRGERGQGRRASHEHVPRRHWWRRGHLAVLRDVRTRLAAPVQAPAARVPFRAGPAARNVVLRVGARPPLGRRVRRGSRRPRPRGRGSRARRRRRRRTGEARDHPRDRRRRRRVRQGRPLLPRRRRGVRGVRAVVRGNLAAMGRPRRGHAEGGRRGAPGGRRRGALPPLARVRRRRPRACSAALGGWCLRLVRPRMDAGGRGELPRRADGRDARQRDRGAAARRVRRRGPGDGGLVGRPA